MAGISKVCVKYLVTVHVFFQYFLQLLVLENSVEISTTEASKLNSQSSFKCNYILQSTVASNSTEKGAAGGCPIPTPCSSNPLAEQKAN